MAQRSQGDKGWNEGLIQVSVHVHIIGAWKEAILLRLCCAQKTSYISQANASELCSTLQASWFYSIK